MAKRIGSAAKSSSRRCFTFVKVTTPIVPRTPLPTKLAAAEKHMGRSLRCEDCTQRRKAANHFYHAAARELFRSGDQKALGSSQARNLKNRIVNSSAKSGGLKFADYRESKDDAHTENDHPHDLQKRGDRGNTCPNLRLRTVVFVVKTGTDRLHDEVTLRTVRGRTSENTRCHDRASPRFVVGRSVGGSPRARFQKPVCGWVSSAASWQNHGRTRLYRAIYASA